MTVCKIQSDSTGSLVLVYSEDRTKVWAMAKGNHAADLCAAARIPRTLGRTFAEVVMDEGGKIHISAILPDQHW